LAVAPPFGPDDAMTAPVLDRLRGLARSGARRSAATAARLRELATSIDVRSLRKEFLRLVRRSPAAVAAAGVAVLVLGLGIWWLAARSTDFLLAPAGSVDPMLVGTFEHDAVIDDYDWRFLYSIAGNGTCRLAISQVDVGTFQVADGLYESTAARSGRVRKGSYRQMGDGGVEVTNASGTVVFHPQPASSATAQPPTAVWAATVTQARLTWTLTIQTNPDSTYRYDARTEDNGSCAFADAQWRSTSAVTGQSTKGTYRMVDARAVEISGSDGAVVWRRQ
jgi:hypothetical protein